MLINANYKLERKVKKTQRTGRSPLRRRRSAMDCGAIEEEKEGKDEGEEEGE
jgi:hypothetical protein